MHPFYFLKAQHFCFGPHAAISAEITDRVIEYRITLDICTTDMWAALPLTGRRGHIKRCAIKLISCRRQIKNSLQSKFLFYLPVFKNRLFVIFYFQLGSKPFDKPINRMK